jgi:hypothetical protein
MDDRTQTDGTGLRLWRAIVKWNLLVRTKQWARKEDTP